MSYHEDFTVLKHNDKKIVGSKLAHCACACRLGPKIGQKRQNL